MLSSVELRDGKFGGWGVHGAKIRGRGSSELRVGIISYQPTHTLFIQ